MNDHNYPLSLSFADVPGALLDEIQLVEIKNYTLWSTATEITLLRRNKLGFVKGFILQSDYEENLKKIWNHCMKLSSLGLYVV